jgi:tetratricopeptide (TPR) repeat protein
MLGDDEPASAYYQKAIDLEPDAGGDPDFFGTVGLAYYKQKTKQVVDAEIILSRAISVYPDTTIKAANKYDRFLYAAAAYALEGQKGKSIYYLQKAAAANWIDYFFTERSPWYDNVRLEPGFKMLMQQLKNKASAYKLKADKE